MLGLGVRMIPSQEAVSLSPPNGRPILSTDLQALNVEMMNFDGIVTETFFFVLDHT